MAFKRNVLVVANVTAMSPALVEAMRTQAERSSTAFTLIVPATPFGGGREAAETKLADAIEHLHAEGLDVRGQVGAADPIVAVTDAWDPKRHDEIIVSTLPMKFSKWLHAGLPERIAKLTDAPVTHVVAEPPRPEVAAEPAHPIADPGPLGPLSVLAWGARKDQ